MCIEINLQKHLRIESGTKFEDTLEQGKYFRFQKGLESGNQCSTSRLKSFVEKNKFFVLLVKVDTTPVILKSDVLRKNALKLTIIEKACKIFLHELKALK